MMRMKRSMKLFSVLFAVAVIAIMSAWAQSQSSGKETKEAVLTPGALPQADVLSYLEQLVQWQRDAAVVGSNEIGARELIFRDTVRQNSLRALRAGFKFARGQASIAPVETPNEVLGQKQQNLNSLARATDERIVNLTAEIRKSSGAARTQLEGQLKLARAEQALYETVQANFNAAASGGGTGFSAKIGNLQRGVPEMLVDENAAPVPTTAKAEEAEKPTTTGVSLLSVSNELFTTARKQRELKAFINHASQVEETGTKMLKALRADLEHALTPNADAPQSVEDRLHDFNQVASVVPPLAEANVWISTSKAALEDWYKTLSTQFTTALKQFGVRLAILLGMLSIPIIAGEVAERMIDRYLPESKRRNQAHTLRRILVGLAVLFILLMNFISDFGSFATFAGFLTAGIAVALQGVLLSLVAHFFFYGRYGVRPGDRVHVGGVTGDIAQIGMVRFYVRELRTNEAGELEPSGKMVAFPNSILFQPSAFYKYV